MSINCLVVGRNRRTLVALLALFAAFTFAACGSSEGETPTETPLPPPPTVVIEDGAVADPNPAATEPATAPTAAPEAELDPMVALAGSYVLPGNIAYADAQNTLILDVDGIGRIEEEQFLGSDQTVVAARGTWVPDGSDAIFTIREVLGSEAGPDPIRFELGDGTAKATEISVDGTLYNIEMAEISIGAGQRNPIVHELHRKLAAVPYLNFTDPGDDLYTEETRQAVVAFQTAVGLEPDGVVDATTWFLLDNPPDPIATPTPVPTPTPASAGPMPTGVPDLSQLPANTEDGRPILYFTFDDGPTLPYTQQIVDTLEQYDARGTFFALGQNAQILPDTIRAATAGGHYIANHTWDHASLKDLTPEQFMDEVQRTEDVVIAAAGDLFNLDGDVRYLRPPYGETDDNTRNYAASLGYAVVLWTIDTQDWRRPGTDVIVDHIMNSVYPGAIILMHDGGGERDQTVAALQQVLPQLRDQGYVFYTIFGP